MDFLRTLKEKKMNYTQEQKELATKRWNELQNIDSSVGYGIDICLLTEDEYADHLCEAVRRRAETRKSIIKELE